MPVIDVVHVPHQSVFDYAHLLRGSTPWWRNSRLIILNMWILVLLLTSSANGFDASLLNGLQSLAEWERDFGYPSGARLGLLCSIHNIGSICAYPFAPYFADGMGRKRSILIGAILMCVGAFIQTASVSVAMFMGARFLIGIGLTFSTTSAPLLILEISYPTLRAPLTSSYKSLWFVGSIAAAWSTYGTFHLASSWAWRIPSALQSIPSLVQLLTIWWLPESPRYLVSKGKRAEALRTLAYYHANGDQENALVEYEYEEIKIALAVERVSSANGGWKSLFMTEGNRRRMRVIIAIAFFSQWSGNGILSYYLSPVLEAVGILRSRDQLLIFGFLNIFNLICAVVAGLLCDKAGRRPLFLASTAIMFLSWSALTVALALYTYKGNQIAAYAFVALLFIYTSGYAIAYTPLIISYTLEILPYALRARGYTVFKFTVTLSVISNQYINPILLDKLGWRYYLVYVCWLVFELVFVYLYVVETKGRTLEQTAALFDGADNAADISYRAAVHTGINQTPADLSRRTSDIPENFEMNQNISTATIKRYSFAEKQQSLAIKSPYHFLEVDKPAIL